MFSGDPVSLACPFALGVREVNDMKLFAGFGFAQKAGVGLVIAALATGAGVGVFASQDGLPGQSPERAATADTATAVATNHASETPEATETPGGESERTPGAVHGIPTENPSHHPADNDGVCEKGETAIKTTPSGTQVNVPCQAADKGEKHASGTNGHRNNRDKTPEATDGTPEATEQPEATDAAEPTDVAEPAEAAEPTDSAGGSTGKHGHSQSDSDDQGDHEAD